MIKSNSKKEIENIRKYIVEWDADYIKERAEYDDRELKTDDEILAYAYELFKDEKRFEIEQNYSNPCFVIFEDWARGLALGGLFCYYNRNAKDDLGEILEETDEEKAKYTEQQAEEYLTRLIYREMEKAHTREWLKTVKRRDA
jgi:hypothetical protein